MACLFFVFCFLFYGILFVIFRHDINALRALAVSAVVVFHFNENWLPGGFVGVDIFFVISGFLMSSIILGNLDRQRFSLIDFYIARGNRIIPPLFILCLFLLLMGLVVLSATSLEDLATEVKHAILFYSNIRYAEETGYFASVAKDNWLLHTWSLSAEWQFYLLFPLVLLLLRNFGGRRAVISGLGILFIASFTASLVLGREGFGSGYYLLQTRAWEMLLGAFACIFAYVGRPFMAPIGYLMIASAFVVARPDESWPGSMALIPTLGVLLVLLGRREYRWLSLTPIRRIGFYSYSIYLWHWPVAVLLYKTGASAIWIPAGIVVSILLGALSFYTIERIRFSRADLSLRNIWYRCIPLLMMVALAACSSQIRSFDGFPERPISNTQDEAMQSVMEHQSYWDHCLSSESAPISVAEACRLNDDRSRLAVIGDSHSVELTQSLGRKLKNTPDAGIVEYSYSGCRPSYGQPESFSYCSAWMNRVVNHVLTTPDIGTVVLAFRYSQHLWGKNEKTFPRLPNTVPQATRDATQAAFEKMVKAFADAGKIVFVVGPIPEIGRTPRTIFEIRSLVDRSLANVPAISRDYYRRRNALILEVINNLKGENVHSIPVDDIFCDSINCFVTRGGKLFYQDDDHPSIYAADEIAKQISQQMGY